ncbi:MAG TPA: hypothetical protein VGR02_10325 [Thermoanaerobaculia bacterium]|nr:hypothetical protein [Thermoanaerobaculia bacterium]
MKKFLIMMGVVAALIGALALYFVLTTPKTSAGIRFPLGAAQRELLASVPASAEAFALIPTAAALDAKLRANRVTRDVVEKWTEQQQLPRPWMIGGADLVVWRSRKQTRYLLRLDPVRAVIVRAYLMFSGEQSLLLEPTGEPRLDAAELSRIVALADGLPPGDVLAVQRQGSRGAYPPIGRPAVTSASISASEINVTSRAAGGDVGAGPHIPQYPKSALLTATFATPPRALDDLNRLVRTRISTLLKDGGAIALYEVETDKLLPRPKEVIILPATEEKRAALQKFVQDVAPAQTLGFRIEVEDTGQELLIAFERPTIDLYLKDTFVPPTLTGNLWTLHIDPKRTVPVLQQVAESPGLRFAAPRLFRSARELSGWIVAMEGAESIEAAASAAAGVEELKVRVRG